MPSSLLHMILLAVLSHLVLAGVRIISSLQALAWHASSFTVGSLMAVFALLPMLFAVPAGRWLDQIGIERPMRGGALVMLAGVAVLFNSSQIASLYLAAALIGIGFMTLHIASQNMVGNLSAPEMRAANFSWLALGFSVSGFCGPVLAGFAIDHVGHHYAFLLFGGFALLLLLLTFVWRFPHQAQAVARATGDGGSSALDLFWRNKPMREIYLLGILLATSWEMFMFVTPLQGTAKGFSAATIGLILGWFSIATFVIRFAMPYIARRFSEWQILCAAFVITCVSFIILPFLQYAWSMMILAFVLGLGLGASQPNMLNLLHQAAPPDRGAEAIGIRVTIGNASQVFLPLTFGAVGASLGLMPVFFMMSAMVAAGMPLVWRKAFG